MRESMLLLQDFKNAYYYLEAYENRLFQENEKRVIAVYNGILESLVMILEHTVGIAIDLDVEWLSEIVKQLRYIQSVSETMRDMECYLENELRSYLDCQMKKIMSLISLDDISTICKASNIEYLKKSIHVEGHQELLSILMQQQLEEYHAEMSRHGVVVLGYDRNGIKHYLRSIVNPLREAAVMAATIARRDADRYIICGCGIDEWIENLKLLKPGVEVNVYSDSKEIILFTLLYKNLENLEKFNLHLYYDLEYKLFAEDAKSHPAGAVIDSNAFVTCKNEKLVRELKNMFSTETSKRNREWEMRASFHKNIHLCSADSSRFIENMKNRTVYIVASGLSLQRNLQQLKERSDNSVIVTVASALRQMLDAGIRPDYIIILESRKFIWSKLESVKTETIPVLMASTAYSRVAQEYAGEKYILCQEGYEPAEKYAKEQGIPTYPEGGTVTTLAMSVAIQSRAKRVVFLGLDLALANNQSYIVNANVAVKSAEKEMFLVDGWNKTNRVVSNHKFDAYRSWFTRRIKELRGEDCKIEIINATEGGSYIEGMEHMTLADAMKQK